VINAQKPSFGHVYTVVTNYKGTETDVYKRVKKPSEFVESRARETEERLKRTIPEGNTLFDQLLGFAQKVKPREKLDADNGFAPGPEEPKNYLGGALPEFSGRDNPSHSPIIEAEVGELYDHWNLRDRNEKLND
jgi:hypothetical protein